MILTRKRKNLVSSSHFVCLFFFLTKYLNLTSALLSVSFQHFNFKGNTLLGLKVAATLRNLLSKAKPRGLSFRALLQACDSEYVSNGHLLKLSLFTLGNNSPPKAPELSAREGEGAIDGF